jgi:hypothetical protein
MRKVLLGTLLVGLLVTIVAGALPEGRQPNAPSLPAPLPARSAAASSDGLIAIGETVEQKYQQVTVIDPKQRVMSVYHIDLASGTITLRSVRNIHWDLRMTDYNGKSPLSREIQALSEQR